MSISLAGTVTNKQDGTPIPRAAVRLYGGAEPLGDVRTAAVRREGAVSWTRTVTGFAGVRWNAWQKFVMNYVAGITWPEFEEQVLEHNPHLAANSGRFERDKRYLLPEQAGAQPDVHWTRPLTGFFGNRWDCWQKYVQGKVDGITWDRFMDEVEQRNPVLVRDGSVFFANKSYVLPENAPGSTELSWTRPLLGFQGNRWQCWEQHVQGQVEGITRSQFFVDVVAYNPILGQENYRFFDNKAYVLPQNPLRPSYYLYDTTDGAGRFGFELLTTPGGYELVAEAPGYHPRVQQFLLTGDAVRDIEMVSTVPTVRSTWADYPTAPPPVRRLIDQALALLGDDAQVFDSLSDELQELAFGHTVDDPNAPHYKDIVCSDLVTIALHAAGVNHRWTVTEPQGTGATTTHFANYYRPSLDHPFLREVGPDEAWLPGDILVYWDGPLASSRMRHVNLYVGPYGGVDLSGNEHDPATGFDVVNASVEGVDHNDVAFGAVTYPLTKESCLTNKAGRDHVQRLRHFELWL